MTASRTSTVTNSRVEMALISGVTFFFGHAVDGHGQGRGRGPGGEVADDEIVNAHGEGRQCAGDDAGLDLRMMTFQKACIQVQPRSIAASTRLRSICRSLGPTERIT